MLGFLRSLLTRLGRHEYLTAAAVFGLLVLVFFSPVFTSHKTFSTVYNVQQRTYPWVDTQHAPKTPHYIQADQALVYYPWEVLTYNTLQQHSELPLWDPQSFGGHPLFANGQTGLAYPPRVALAAVTSPSWTHDIYLMFHIWLGGFAMFALMKELGARFAGALLSGVAWSFSSYTAFWIQLENFAVVLALLPFIVLCIRRWHVRRSWRAFAVASLLLGVVFLGASPELSLACFVLAFAYAACQGLTRLVREWRQLTTRHRLVIAAAPAALVIVALAVAAVALLPFLELTSRYGRESFTLSENLELFRVVPRDLLHTFVPAKLPLPLDATAIMNQAEFVGTVAAFLALVGFFLGRRPGAGLARGIVAFVFLFVAVPPFAWLVYNGIPMLSSVVGLGRTFFVWNFAVAILAGLGLDAVIAAVRRRGRSIPAARRVAPAMLAVACIGLTAAQLLVYMRDANAPFQPRAGTHLFPDTAATSAVRQAIGGTPGRERLLPFTGPDAPLPVLWAIPMALDLPSAGGYESSVPEDTSDLWRVVAGESVAAVKRQPLCCAFSPSFRRGMRFDLLGRVGVSAVLASPGTAFSPAELQARGMREVYRGQDGVVFEVVDRPGRAFVVDEAVRVEDTDQALRRFLAPSFDPRREVILEDGGEDPETSSPERAGASSGRVSWVTDTPNELGLEVQADRPGWLVVLDSWDPGWSASVNGRSADIVRADFNFRAVRVPAGTSTVHMSYRPPGLVPGMAVSAAAVLLIVAFVLAPPVRRYLRARSRGTAASPDGATGQGGAGGSGPAAPPRS